MNKIKILSLQEAQKIAAGEVVERPAHIVKELIENSIDAGSTQISLYIEKAGKTLIRIVDNGSGMSPDDAQICFLPHATSKVTSLDDLETIKSFGFRGEALASIAAVSKVVLITKLRTSTLGIRLEYSESICTSTSEIVAQAGTDISVRDLFFNIPARKKFLKQDATEWNQIQDIFYAVCLSHQDISFKLYHDNKLILNAPGVNNVKDRVTQLWDHNFSQNLIPLVIEKNEEKQSARPSLDTQATRDTRDIKVSKGASDYAVFNGMISNHQFWRYGRDAIYFFVNNRWVKNQELSKSLLKGYLNVLPPGKFPAAFIFITIDQVLVDVNVHPKKEEVRFTKPGVVEASLQISVRMSLEQNLSQKLQHTGQFTEQKTQDLFESPVQVQNQNFQDQDQDQDFKAPMISEELFNRLPVFNTFPSNLADGLKYPARTPFLLRPTGGYEEQVVSTVLGSKNISNLLTQTPKQEPEIHEQQAFYAPKKAFEQAKIIGQIFNTYIILDNKTELILIDQHAAHERILYEEFLKNFEKKDGITLMFPDLVTLTSHQIDMIMREKDFFFDQGIAFDLVGNNTLAIKSAPPKIAQQSLKELLLEAVNFIQEHEKLERELFRKKLNEHVHSHMACKAAVKAGDVLTMQQMQQLVTDLEKTEKRFICVHGRPTTWTIAQDIIEKNFRRK